MGRDEEVVSSGGVLVEKHKPDLFVKIMILSFAMSE